MMGLQDAGICGTRRKGRFFQYQELECQDDGASPRPRRQWLPSLNGKAACSCFSSLKKLKWSKITTVLLLRKAPQASSRIQHASASVTDVDNSCPTIIFLSQWGLPVLSCPSMAGSKGKYHHGKGF